MIRVLVADDHPVVRDGLRQLMAETPDIRTVAETGDGHEALALLAETKPDVAVVDIAMPGPGILELLQSCRREHPATGLLVLTMYPEEQYARRLLRAGALGYVTKDTAGDELIDAIRRVAEGRPWVSDSLAEMLAGEIMEGPPPREPHEILSDREYEVMCRIADGKTVSEIALEMHLSVKTVSTYRSRLMEKTGLRTNAEIIRYAIERGLV